MRNTASNRRAQPGAGLGGGVAVATVMVLLLVALLAVYAAVHLGRQLAGLSPAPTGLSSTLRGLVRGTLGWPPEATVVLVGLVVSVLAAAGAIALWWVRRRRRASRVDWTASVLGRGREIEGISSKNVTATAKRLGVSAAAPGITVGRTVAPPRDSVLASWEDMMLLLAGPRIGKSTSYAIPAILDAPGAALVTSNKRDLADATRDPRAAPGARCGSSIRRTSPARSPPGGGTRSATSPMR